MYYLFFTLFLLFINNTFATSYLECLQNNFIEFNATDIIIGARNTDCVMSCASRLKYNFFCYSDVGFHYDLWYWIIMVGYIFIFMTSIYSLYIMYSKEKHFNTKPNMLTTYLNIWTSTIRIIWLSLIYNNRTPDVLPHIEIYDKILEKLGQTTILIELFLIITLWKNIINSTNNMQQHNKTNNHKLNSFIQFVYISLCLITLPLTIFGAIIDPL